MKEVFKKLFKRIKSGITRLFKRFPVATCYIILQFIAFSLITEWDYFNIHPKQLYFIVLMSLTTYALIFHSIAIQFITERLKLSLKQNLLFNGLSVLVTSGIFALLTYKDLRAFDTLSGNFTGNMYRLAIFIVLSGLLVILVPFWKDKGNKVWWTFTMYSINKFAISLVYSIVLYVGVAIALGALKEFWDITIFDHQFELMAFFSFILFAPLNFLSDVFDFNFKGELILPNFMAIFGKFILTPLIAIYTLILYPYMFSFPFKQSWPSNQSTFIILAMLAMIYTVMYIFWNTKEDEKDFKFFKWFTIITNAISVPTILFWAYSLWLRIDAYKLTVNRFALMAIILWFLFNSVYLLLAKNKDIKVILTSFIGVIVLTFYLPFSAFYFGQKAQLKRLNDIAIEQGVLSNDKYVVVDKEKTSNSDQEMKDIISYLNQFHTLNKVKGTFSQEIAKKLEIDKYGYSKYFSSRMEYGSNLFFKELLPQSGITPYVDNYININLDNANIKIPEGYKTFDVLDSYSYPYLKITKNTVEFNSYKYTIDIDLESDKLLTVPISPTIGKSMYSGPNTYAVQDPTFLTFESRETLFVVTELNGMIKDGKLAEINSISGIIFKK